MEINFIGKIQSPYFKLEDCPANGWASNNISKIIVADKYFEGMKGIKEGMLIHVIWWFHKAKRNILAQNIEWGGELIGVFAMRSPQRPNPVALSLCKVVKIERNSIFVIGLEALNESPVLDIKKAINYEGYIL